EDPTAENRTSCEVIGQRPLRPYSLLRLQRAGTHLGSIAREVVRNWAVRWLYFDGLSTRPATASSFLTRSGSRFSGAVMIAYSSAWSEPTPQAGCSRGKSRASRVTKRLAFSLLPFSTRRIDMMSTSP